MMPTNRCIRNDIRAVGLVVNKTTDLVQQARSDGEDVDLRLDVRGHFLAILAGIEVRFHPAEPL